MTQLARDARPFLAHHLRARADAGDAMDPAGLHLLARWVENLPPNDPRMAAIEATNALGYDDGSFDGGPESEELITGCEVGADVVARDGWLERFADAVRRNWA
jgi:hypothetical protein